MYDTQQYPKANSNLKTLQILRAIAAASVVYFHIDTTPRFGSFGVDIFFIISGFVMAMVLANGQTPHIFAIHRITRIVPLYWILTTCVLVLAAIKPELLNSTTANITNYLKSLFFIPYFKENGAPHPMLAVGWTLNYEMFFYLCIWLSIIAARKFYIPITIFLLVVTYVFLGELSNNALLESVFGNSLMFEFAFGILTFHIYKRYALKKLGYVVLLILAVLSYLFMVYAETMDIKIPRVYIYGIPSILLVLSVAALEESVVIKNTWLVNMLTKIGDASYATYLSHFYVVEGIRKIGFQKLKLINPYTPLGVLIILFFSLAVGHFLYFTVDKPLSGFFKKKLQAKAIRQHM